MMRTRSMLLAALLAALTSCGGSADSRDPVAAGAEDLPPHNLLLITVDTLRADRLGAYGHRSSITPHLDALADSGVVFEAAYATSSWTLPSIVSLLTAQYAGTHECTKNDARLADSLETLAERLSEAGFHTGAIVNHLFLSERYGLAQGFAHFDEELVHSTYADSHLAVTSPTVTKKAITWLRERSNEPGRRWLLWVHYFDPHELYQAHPITAASLPIEHAIDRYGSEVALTDASIGELLDEMRALEFDRNTVIALVADHGEEFGDHGGRGHRSTLYDEVLRVPCVLAGPGLGTSSGIARRVSSRVSTVDMMPTLLELLDVAAPAYLDGRSVLDVVRGGTHEASGILAELEEGPRGWDAWIDGRWKLIRAGAAGGTLLFDLESDPGERFEVGAAHPEVVRRLEAAMEAAKTRCARKRDAFGGAVDLQLLEEELRRLEQLGYGGDDDR